MTTPKMITRTFALYRKAETKDTVYVTIINKEGEEVGAWLPKAEIKISNRKFGFGGNRTADITMPVSLVSMFNSKVSEEGQLNAAIIDAGFNLTDVYVRKNDDNTWVLFGYDKERNLRGSFDTIKALIKIK